jgi:hypothetical protein
MNGLRAYVRCTLNGGRSGGGRRQVSDVPIPDHHRRGACAVRERSWLRLKRLEQLLGALEIRGVPKPSVNNPNFGSIGLDPAGSAGRIGNGHRHLSPDSDVNFRRAVLLLLVVSGASLLAKTII